MMSRDLENLRQIKKRTKELDREIINLRIKWNEDREIINLRIKWNEDREIINLRIKWNEDRRRMYKPPTHKYYFWHFFNICWK